MKERLTEEEKKRRHRAAVKRWKAQNPEKDAEYKKKANANFRAKNPSYFQQYWEKKGITHAQGVKIWKMKNPERNAENVKRANANFRAKNPSYFKDYHIKSSGYVQFMQMLKTVSLIANLAKTSRAAPNENADH